MFHVEHLETHPLYLENQTRKNFLQNLNEKELEPL